MRVARLLLGCYCVCLLSIYHYTKHESFGIYYLKELGSEVIHYLIIKFLHAADGETINYCDRHRIVVVEMF